MNDFTKANYYALFLAITKGESSNKALSEMGIYPESEEMED